MRPVRMYDVGSSQVATQGLKDYFIGNNNQKRVSTFWMKAVGSTEVETLLLL